MTMLSRSLAAFRIALRGRFLFRLFNVFFLTFLLALFLAFATAAWNLHAYFDRTAAGVTFYAFVAKGEKGDAAKAVLANWPEVGTVRLIAPAEGLALLKKSLGKDSAILGTIDVSPLPETIEVTLKPEFVDPGDIGRFKAKLQQYKQFDWIDSTEKFVGSVLQLKRFMIVAFWTGIALLVVVIFLSLQIVNRAIMHRYSSTIALLKLLGARDSFLAIPFIVDGLVEALVSAAAASALCHGATIWMTGRFSVIGIALTPVDPVLYAPFIAAVAVVGALSGLHFARIPEH